jgi:UDP-N-acetylglucosamine pyrophosphorylase
MAIFTTKPLNDGTKGNRFQIVGIKGMYRIRKYKRRAFQIDVQKTFASVHYGRFTLHIESGLPHRLYRFAG